MFEYLKGTLTDKYTSNTGFYIVVETAGVGYRLEVSQSDFENCPKHESELKIYTKLLHKEDAMTLCGFLKQRW